MPGLLECFACLVLEDGDEVNGLHVGFILLSFPGRQPALVAFVSEFIDPGLRLGISAEFSDGAGPLRRQGLSQGMEESVHSAGIRFAFHATIVQHQGGGKEGCANRYWS